MKFQKWHIAKADSHDVERLMEAGYPYLVASVLSSRGIHTVEQAAEFLDLDTSLEHSPFLMQDMDLAVARINDALLRNERIAVFGDYDVDGITATCILVDYLQNHGGDVIHYIPRRIEDGYGLSPDAIASLHQQGAKLLITVDCGITGVEEVDFANSMGMDVVITDHHECKDQLPRAAAVVDPHRPDCHYPFKHLAGCGVALKLVLALGGAGREEALFARYCTLAAIGTVADVMQMSGENRTIVSRGLATIDHSDFIGLHALLQESGLAEKEITSTQIGFVLSPRINAAGRMGAADMAADLLLCKDPAKAEEMAKALCALNRERQSVEQDIYLQAEEMIADMPEYQRSALVLSSEKWHQGVVGIVASRLSEKYSRPSFMIHMNGSVGKGSCRSWGGFNLFAALENCSDLLLGFGGHELAAGFTIEEKNIPAFRERMNQFAKEYRGGARPISRLDVDVAITQPHRITLAELESLSTLEPYGSGNTRPIFCLLGATLQRTQNVGQNRHLKLRLSKGPAQFDGIFFSTTAEDCAVEIGDRVDAAFYLQINEFRGNRSVQLQMVDLRPSLLPSTREQENLSLLQRFLQNEPLSAKEIHRFQVTREQAAAVWRMLETLIPPEGLKTGYLPLLRNLSQHIGKNEPFLHAAMTLEIFAERGLLHMEQDGEGDVSVRLISGKKVSLTESVYWQRAEQMANASRGGGI